MNYEFTSVDVHRVLQSKCTKTHSKVSNRNEHLFVSPTLAAAYFNKSIRTIYRRAKAGKIPCHYLPTLRFSMKELMALSGMCNDTPILSLNSHQPAA